MKYKLNAIFIEKYRTRSLEIINMIAKMYFFKKMIVNFKKADI